MNNYPHIDIAMVANVFARMMVFEKKGDCEIGHTHPFDHITLLASGSLQISIEGKISEHKAPTMIFIRKDKVHELTALENNTVAYCVHAVRDADTGDILSPEMVPGYENIGKFCDEI